MQPCRRQGASAPIGRMYSTPVSLRFRWCASRTGALPARSARAFRRDAARSQSTMWIPIAPSCTVRDARAVSVRRRLQLLDEARRHRDLDVVVLDRCVALRRAAPRASAAAASPAIARSEQGRAAARTLRLPLHLHLLLLATRFRYRGRIGTDEHGVDDLHDLVDGKHGLAGVAADRLRARRLVDADRADAAVALLEHVAADPGDVVRHPLAFGRRARRGLAELGAVLPAAPRAGSRTCPSVSFRRT